jgi:hypothetical protein
VCPRSGGRRDRARVRIRVVVRPMGIFTSAVQRAFVGFGCGTALLENFRRQVGRKSGDLQPTRAYSSRFAPVESLPGATRPLYF